MLCCVLTLWSTRISGDELGLLSRLRALADGAFLMGAAVFVGHRGLPASALGELILHCRRGASCLRLLLIMCVLL